MLPEDELYVNQLLNDEPVLRKEKVRFEVAIGNQPIKARVLSTPTRMLLYARTPMGLQLTVVRYANVDCITTGKTANRTVSPAPGRCLPHSAYLWFKEKA